MASDQPSRNDPCPCGSGLKYKKCCLPREQEARANPISSFAFAGAPSFSVADTQTTGQRRPPSPSVILPPRSIRKVEFLDVEGPEPPPADSVPLLPVEVAVKYLYVEPSGTAEVSYIFPGGRIFVLDSGLPIHVDDLKPGMRIQLRHAIIATVTAVAFDFEPPDPPTQIAEGLVRSRVMGTIKHHANTVMDVSWSGYTATGTPSHPYYSVDRQAYVPAEELRLGELLKTDANTVAPVQSISPPRHGNFEVFNLEVEHFHNYFVGSGGGGAVLVHNGGCIEQPKAWELEEMAEGGLSVRTPNQAGLSGAGGRLGSPEVRAQNAALAQIIRDRGMTVVSGGDLGFETLIRGPGGGARGGAYADIVAVRNGRQFFVQTVDTLADGITPTAQELAAAANIRKLTGGHVILVPKGKMGF